MVDDPRTPPRTPLQEMAAFISERANRERLDQRIVAHLSEVAELHDSWSAACRVGHWHDDTPCPEYEAALAVAIAWLMQRIEDDEQERR